MTIYNHTFEKSSFLDNASYNSETMELTVGFQNGKSYAYKEVAYNTYTDLINAKSAGGYFASIKNNLVLK